jgi:hypothetical protein
LIEDLNGENQEEHPHLPMSGYRRTAAGLFVQWHIAGRLLVALHSKPVRASPVPADAVALAIL